MIGDFVWSGLRKKIEDFGWWFFFFFSCYGLVVVAAAIVGVADGRGGCDWCCGCFLASG